MERQWNGAAWRALPLILGVAAASVVVLSSPTRAVELALRWTSVSATDGYRLYIGQTSRRYTQQLDLGPLTGNIVGGIVHMHLTGLLVDTPYFLAVTAYNVAGESAYSNEKFVQFAASDMPPVANAGPDRAGAVGQTLSLGSPPQPGVNYVWLQTVGPAAVLQSRTSSTTNFVPLVPGVFEFVQVAFDAVGLASSDAVTIVVASPTVTPTNITPVREERTRTPTASATRTHTSTRTPTSTRSPTASPTPPASATRTPSRTPTRTPTSTRFPTASPTPTPTATPTRTWTLTLTPTSTRSPTVIASPSSRLPDSPTPSVTATATSAPEATRTYTPARTLTPTFTGTSTPLAVQTLSPTPSATTAPTASPSPRRSDPPTQSPTSVPTARTDPTYTPLPVSTATLTATSTPLATSPPSPTEGAPRTPSVSPPATSTVTPHTARSGTPTLVPTPTLSPTGTPTPTDMPGPTDVVDSTPPPPSPVVPNATCRKAMDSGAVTIALLVTAVSIVLDELPLESCPALDLDRNGVLRLNEVVKLVTVALGQASWLPGGDSRRQFNLTGR